MKNTLLTALLFATSFAFAQNSNIFLNRSFWTTKPGVQKIEQMIKAGHDPSALNDDGFDPVCWAILEGSSDITIKHLLRQKGNDLNKKTHKDRTYFFFAAQKGNIELMKYFISQGAKITAVDKEGYSPLNVMVKEGQTNTKIYDFLLQNGANLKADKTKEGVNALLLLAENAKDFELIDYFTQKGLSLHSTDKEGNNMFSYAAKSGNMTLMQQLIEKGVDHKIVNKKGENIILFLCQNNASSLTIFKYLVEQGVAANVTTKKGLTPLHLLAKNSKDVKLFQFFIENGVAVNKADQAGNTVFMQAAQYSTLPIVTALQSEVKDVNLLNKSGESPLALALRHNTYDVVQFLLEKGANVEIIDYRGHHLGKVLMESYLPKKSKDFEQKRMALTNKGLDLSQPHENGNTLLHVAVTHNDVALLKSLESLNIDVNTKNNNGFTALHVAAKQSNNKAVLDYLLQIGADKSIQTDFDDSVFDLAAENQAFKERKIDINFLK